MPHIGRDIVPSHLSVSSTERYHDGGVFDNTRLRFGEVQEVVYPNDPKSLSKKFVEYSVFVQHRSNNGTALGKMYNHVTLANTFGGLADQCHWTLRADATPSTKQKGANGLGKGSKVVMLCLNGENNNAVILGGLRDQADVSGFGGKEAKDLGHYFHFNFNGVSADIDKDGQFTLVYGGKTEVDGTTKVDSSKVGTQFQLDKDGNAKLGDKDGKNLFMIDHANSKVVIKRDSAFELGEASDFMLLGPELPPGTAEDEQPAPQPLQHAQGPAHDRRRRHYRSGAGPCRHRRAPGRPGTRWRVPDDRRQRRRSDGHRHPELRAGGQLQEQLPVEEEQGRLGRTQSPEHRAKIAAAMRARRQQS
jgi:hypothetical protein